jgi:hypothetical protein
VRTQERGESAHGPDAGLVLLLKPTYGLNIRDSLLPGGSVSVSHQPVGMRMHEARGDILHCFRVEIPTYVNRQPPRLALSSCTTVNVKCLSCVRKGRAY